MDDKWIIFESQSGRFFKSTYDAVLTTVDYLNKKIETEVLKWNDIFRAFELPELDIGELPFDYDKVSSHLNFSFDVGDSSPLLVIDYIKN